MNHQLDLLWKIKVTSGENQLDNYKVKLPTAQQILKQQERG